MISPELSSTIFTFSARGLGFEGSFDCSDAAGEEESLVAEIFLEETGYC